MTAQPGALVLIKAGNGGSPEIFTTIGGLRTSILTLDNHPLDATTVESGNWRQVLGNAGISAITISGSGIFTDVASEERVRSNAFSASISNYQFVFANGDIVAGPFLIASYQRSGQYDSEEIYSLTLESAGTITFTPA